MILSIHIFILIFCNDNKYTQELHKTPKVYNKYHPKELSERITFNCLNDQAKKGTEQLILK